MRVGKHNVHEGGWRSVRSLQTISSLKTNVFRWIPGVGSGSKHARIWSIGRWDVRLFTVMHFADLQCRDISSEFLVARTVLRLQGQLQRATRVRKTLHLNLAWHSSKCFRVQFTRVTLFFKEQQFITSERNELYGLTDFLANCGGLLGLFTGFSFLSTVEILYFISIRFICNIRKFGKHFWSGSPELLNNDAFEHPVR